MFKKGDRWRHRNCLDVDVVVCRLPSSDGLKTKLTVRYWNRQYRTFAHPDSEEVFISHQDSDNWTLMEENFV